jgi:hypothetical protein
MQNQASGRRRSHGVRHLEEPTEQRLCELVGLRVRHEEKYQSRDERILRLEPDIGERHFIEAREYTLASTPFLRLPVLVRVRNVQSRGALRAYS